MAGDATEDPKEPTRPEDLTEDRTGESPNPFDAASARALGDILSGKDTQNPAEKRASVDDAWVRLVIGFIIVAGLGGVYGCTQLLGDDDETTAGVPEQSSLSELDDAATESSTPAGGTVPNIVPEELKVARPSTGRVTGANTVVVEFPGDAKSLAEGGELTLFEVSVRVTDGPITVSLLYSIADGVARQSAIKTDAADSVATEDGGGTITSGVSGPLEGTFTGPGELTLTLSTFDLPPGAEVTVQSVLQQSGSGTMHVLDPE